jgi:hypothetical protein
MIGFDGSFGPTAAKGARFYYGTSKAPISVTFGKRRENTA